jgi:hypothetical protein
VRSPAALSPEPGGHERTGTVGRPESSIRAAELARDIGGST